MVLTALAGAAFIAASVQLGKAAHALDPDNGLRAILPGFVQVILSGGDPYLAADINVIRSLVATTFQAGPEEFASQAQAQMDAAWLNPYHEDNYYLAAATLSWNQQISAANKVLEAAAVNRKFDPMPAFLLAFNHYYFYQDPLTGAHWLNVAAENSNDEQSRLAFKKMAARWLEKSSDLPDAIRLLELMASQAKYRSLRENINTRLARIKGLNALRQAAIAYEVKRGRVPANLDVLVREGFIGKIPPDPMNQGFQIDSRGVPQFIQPPGNRK